MRPRYNPRRGRYESEHWERPEAFAVRRFCSRHCQNSWMAGRRIYVENTARNDEIRRLARQGWPRDRIAAHLGLNRGVVVGVLYRDQAKARGGRPAGGRGGPTPVRNPDEKS
jgi:hypothetical protein